MGPYLLLSHLWHGTFMSPHRSDRLCQDAASYYPTRLPPGNYLVDRRRSESLHGVVGGIWPAIPHGHSGLLSYEQSHHQPLGRVEVRMEDRKKFGHAII